MSDAECGAICVRKDVMDKFNVIVQGSRLDANELMEHFFNLYNCHSELKSESEDFIPVGMTYNAGGAGGNMGDRGNTSKNSSASDGDDVTCLGVTPAGGDFSVDQKIQMLQRLRDQASSFTSQANQSSSGSYQQYNAFAGGMGPPSMVSIPTAGHLADMMPPKKKKKNKKQKPTPVAAPPPIPDGEDLLKSSMCSLCQATFARFTDLLAHHKEVHTADTNHPLRCKACGRTQTSEAGLIYHQVYVCKMVERPHQCVICTLKFQSEEMVLVHKCSGCPRKRYACEFCDHYRTESSSDLEKHMRIHTNDKCYVCKICGFSTAWKKNLKEHMVKHLGLKPYVCDMCGYSTSDRHNLRSHRMKHYEKGEGCQKCGGQCHCSISKPMATKKRKQSGEGGVLSVSPGSPGSSGGKEFECPYPQCVYRTKIEYMMTNHMLRHQGALTASRTGTSSGVTIVSSGQSTSTASSSNFRGSSQPSQSSVKIPPPKGQGIFSSSAGAYLESINAIPSGSSPSPAPTPTASTAAAPPVSQGTSATLISTTGQLPLEWKTITQAQTPVMLSAPANFSPLVQHQQSHVTAQVVTTGTIASWPTALSASGVPAGLIAANRVTVPVAQSMVARPMPVFPNMPN